MNNNRTLVNLLRCCLRVFPLMVLMVLLSVVSYSQSANLDQVRNGAFDSPTTPGAWVNGNVNASQAHMVEGYSIPYRVVMEGLTIGVPIELDIEFDTKHSDAHAIDFITYFDNLQPHDIWGHTAEVINPLIGYPAVPTTPAYATIPAPSVTDPVEHPTQPTAAFNALPADMKRMTLFGGTFALVDPVTYLEEQSTSPSVASTSVRIKFTPTSTTAILAWGGHIAKEEDYLPGQSAAGISGSPYHTRLLDWNLTNLGNQDRSLQAAAVLILPHCDFTSTLASPVCTGTSITFNVIETHPDVTYDWLVIQHGTNATPASGTGTSFTVNSGTQVGNFDVRLIASIPFSGTLLADTCFVNVVVNAVSLSTSVTNVLCFGGSTGAINLTASGGLAPYTFAWTASAGGVIPAGQADDEDLSGLVAGTYSVSVIDASGCTATTSASVTQPASLPSTTETHVNVLCFGNATGSINLSVSGGTPGYTYAWTASAGGVIPAGQADDQDLSGLVAGTYSVVVTDANGCTANRSVTITQPPLLTTSESHVNVLCFGGATGSINLSVSGGTPAFSYAWTASAGGVIPAGQADDQDLSGLVAGTYSVIVTDANGCTANRSVTITQPPLLTTSESHVNVLCFGNATGSINLSVSGGTPAFSYAWTASAGGVIPAGQADDQDLTGLVAGTYSVIVTDANGCTANRSVTITQPPLLTTSESHVNVLCFGNATGSINLSVSGGTPGFTFAWTASAGGVIPAGQADDEDLSGLVAGTYSVVVTDANGCTANRSVTITQPASGLSTSETHANVLCFGGATGSINLTVSGGTPAYIFAWTASAGGVIPAGQADDEDLSGLVAGTYSVVVTDASGCTTNRSVTITQPALLTTSESHVNVLCFGNATGSINLSVSGGTPAYSYAWTASAGGVIPAGQADDQDLSGLVAGTYSVVVTDANGCTANRSVTITQPPLLTTSESHVNVLCFGNATGSINLSVSGGTPGFTYAWTASAGGVIPAGQADDQDLSGLVAGTYSVVVTDANGCTANRSVTITQPPLLTTSESHVNVLCFGNATGSINLSVSGGTPGFTYAWTASAGGVIPAGQADDQDLSGLVAGTYSVVVTDANGCTANRSVTITQPPLLTTSESHVNVLCFGGATGSINLSVSGGTPAFSYAWTASAGGVIPAGQADDQDLSGLVAGTYSVVVTDANGCTANRSVTITQPNALSCSIAYPNEEPGCGTPNNTLTATVSGGTGTISYAWSVSSSNNDWIITGGADLQTVTYTAGSGMGSFSLLVTDQNGCTSTCTLTVTCVSQDEFCSLTQGFYGNPGGYYCNGMGTYELIDSLLNAMGGMVIGVPANNKTFTIPVTGAQCVINILPGGGSSYVLPGNNGCGNLGTLINPNKGTLNNILLAQTITLKLNLWLTPTLGGFVFTSPEFYTRSSSGCGGGSANGNYPLDDSTHFLLPASVVSYLGGTPSVLAIFNLANDALGGVAGLPPLGDINSAVDIINRAFDECAFIFFIVQPPQLFPTGSSQTGGAVTQDKTVELTIAPNPFQSQTDVSFSLTFDSKVTVEIFNMLGSKVATLYDGEAVAGQVYTYTFTSADDSSQQVYLCVVRTSQGNTVKRMLLNR